MVMVKCDLVIDRKISVLLLLSVVMISSVFSSGGFRCEVESLDVLLEG